MTELLLDNSRKILKYKIFYENSTSGSRGVTLGRRDRETDIKKLTVTIQNFARAQIRDRQIYIINTHMCYCHINLLKIL